MGGRHCSGEGGWILPRGSSFSFPHSYVASMKEAGFSLVASRSYVALVGQGLVHVCEHGSYFPLCEGLWGCLVWSWGGSLQSAGQASSYGFLPFGFDTLGGLFPQAASVVVRSLNPTMSDATGKRCFVMILEAFHDR